MYKLMGITFNDNERIGFILFIPSTDKGVGVEGIKSKIEWNIK